MNKGCSLIILSTFFSTLTYASDSSNTEKTTDTYVINMVRQEKDDEDKRRDRIYSLIEKIKLQEEIIQKQKVIITDYEKLVSTLRLELKKANNNGK